MPSETIDVGPAVFADHTTLRIGGPVARWITARTEEACIEALVECDDIGGDVIVVGGGSNIVCSDAPFDGTVVQIAPTGVSMMDRGGHLSVVAAAGESWDDLVVRTLEAGSGYLAPLSGIPGLVGATPIQNVGAYGVEVSEVITAVRVWDRRERSVRELSDEDCHFGYRSSMFKDSPERFVILEVVFDLPLDPFVVVDYHQLAEYLGMEVGSTADGRQVRSAVLALRRAKGMVLEDEDRDTWSVGSFFVNPVLSVDQARDLPSDCPTFTTREGIKASAAWLIEHSGIARGFGLPGSGARVSTKHTLAICNAGTATCEDVVQLARAIRAQVRDRFGVELQVEPRLIGCSL